MMNDDAHASCCVNVTTGIPPRVPLHRLGSSLGASGKRGVIAANRHPAMNCNFLPLTWRTGLDVDGGITCWGWGGEMLI